MNQRELKLMRVNTLKSLHSFVRKVFRHKSASKVSRVVPHSHEASQVGVGPTRPPSPTCEWGVADRCWERFHPRLRGWESGG